MSPSQCRATAHNFTASAQNLEMCKRVLKNDALLPGLQVFLHTFSPFYVKFWVYFEDFLAQIFLKLGFDGARNPVSECLSGNITFEPKGIL